MDAAHHWVRAESRHQRGSLALVAGVVALLTTLVLTAVLGAVRSGGALARLRAETSASDARVGAGDPALTTTPEILRTVAGVTAVGLEAQLAVTPDFDSLFPGYHIRAIAPLPRARTDRIDTLHVTAGRAPDPDVIDEIVLSEGLASATGLEVGDHVTLHSGSDAWMTASFAGGADGPPDGPTIDAEVVGLDRTQADFADRVGRITLTPAFVERYSIEVQTWAFATARFDQASNRDRFMAEGAAALGLEPEATIADDDARDGLRAIAASLWVLGAVATLTGLAVVAQIVAVAARQARRESGALLAIGWTRPQVAAATIGLIAPAVLVGVALGLLGAIVASPLALVALARRVDPHPARIVISAPILALGGLVIVTVVVVLVTVTVRITGRRRRRTPTSSTRWPRLRHPLPVVLGTRAALGTTGSTATTRSVLGGCILAVAGMGATVAIGASIANLTTDLTLSGQDDGYSIDSGEATTLLDEALPILEQDDRIAYLSVIHVFFPRVGDLGEVSAIGLDRRIGDEPISLVSGRAPNRDDEVLVGPATLEQLGLEVGDELTLGDTRGDAAFRIVGTVLFPPGDFTFDEGVAVTASGASRLIGDPRVGAEIHSLSFDWEDGVDAEVANAALGIRVFGGGTSPTLVPGTVRSIGQVRGVTQFLALLFAVLATGIVAHGLLAAVRRGRGDAGVLRSLGLGAGSARRVIVTQALTTTAIGLLIGLPTGLVFGRRIWDRLATSAHVVPHAVFPAGTIALVALAIASAVALVASVPAVRSPRATPTSASRTE